MHSWPSSKHNMVPQPMRGSTVLHASRRIESSGRVIADVEQELKVSMTCASFHVEQIGSNR